MAKKEELLKEQYQELAEDYILLTGKNLQFLRVSKKRKLLIGTQENGAEHIEISIKPEDAKKTVEQESGKLKRLSEDEMAKAVQEAVRNKFQINPEIEIKANGEKGCRVKIRFPELDLFAFAQTSFSCKPFDMTVVGARRKVQNIVVDVNWKTILDLERDIHAYIWKKLDTEKKRETVLEYSPYHRTGGPDFIQNVYLYLNALVKKQGQAELLPKTLFHVANGKKKGLHINFRLWKLLQLNPKTTKTEFLHALTSTLDQEFSWYDRILKHRAAYDQAITYFKEYFTSKGKRLSITIRKDGCICFISLVSGNHYVIDPAQPYKAKFKKSEQEAKRKKEKEQKEKERQQKELVLQSESIKNMFVMLLIELVADANKHSRYPTETRIVQAVRGLKIDPWYACMQGFMEKTGIDFNLVQENRIHQLLGIAISEGFLKEKYKQNDYTEYYVHCTDKSYDLYCSLPEQKRENLKKKGQRKEVDAMLLKKPSLSAFVQKMIPYFVENPEVLCFFREQVKEYLTPFAGRAEQYLKTMIALAENKDEKKVLRELQKLAKEQGKKSVSVI